MPRRRGPSGRWSVLPGARRVKKPGSGRKPGTAAPPSVIRTIPGLSGISDEKDSARRDALLKEMATKHFDKAPKSAAIVKLFVETIFDPSGKKPLDIAALDRLIENFPEEGRGNACFFVGQAAIALARESATRNRKAIPFVNHKNRGANTRENDSERFRHGDASGGTPQPVHWP